MKTERMALVTVASDDFLAGALVMVESFQRHNPSFSGDVVVIYESLSAKSFDILDSCFPNLVKRKLSAALAKRVAEVRRYAGWTGNKHLQFGSLEAFAIAGYDRVIFCDSDLLFLASVEPLLEMESALVCCGDGTYYRGNRRCIFDFAEVPSIRDGARENSIGNTFNSGLMVLDSRLITAENFRGLCGMMDPARWASDRTGHTDQMILNLYLAGEQELASPAYNYLLSHRELIESSTGVAADQAKVVHFTGPQKPWHPLEAFEADGVDRQYFTFYAEWRAMLESLNGRLAFDLPGALRQL